VHEEAVTFYKRIRPELLSRPDRPKKIENGVVISRTTKRKIITINNYEKKKRHCRPHLLSRNSLQ